jgi:hypothetical protein
LRSYLARKEQNMRFPFPLWSLSILFSNDGHVFMTWMQMSTILWIIEFFGQG